MRLAAVWPAAAVFALASTLLPTVSHAVVPQASSVGHHVAATKNPHPPTVCPSTGAGPDAPTSNVSAEDGTGVAFPQDPTLSTQQTVYTTVTGFAPGADVKVWLANSLNSEHHNANASGTLTYNYALAGLNFGSYRLLFQGAPPAAANTGSGNILVTVPTIAQYPFIVGCDHKVKSSVVTISKIVLKAKPTTVAPGKNVTLTGYIAVGSTKLRVPLQLWASTAGGSWKKVSTKTPPASKTVTFTVKPKSSTRYQIRYAGGTVGSTTYTAAKSASVAVTVVPKLTLAIPAKVTHGASAKATVTLTPKQAARTVYLIVDGKPVQHAKTNAKGQVLFTVTFATGRHSVRAYLPANSQYGASYSKTSTVTAK
jgi:hypothetical protein